MLSVKMLSAAARTASNLTPPVLPNAYWPMLESSGSRLDFIGENNLLETGSVGYANDDDLGACAVFDGVGHNWLHFDYDSNLLQINTEDTFCISFWLKINTLPPVLGSPYGFCQGTGGNRINGIYVFGPGIICPSAAIQLSYFYGSGAAGTAANILSTSPPTTNTPYHITMVNDPDGKCEFFIDGISQGVGYPNQNYSSRSPNLIFGALNEDFATSFLLNHKIAKAAYWKNYLLSEEQIRWLYNEGAVRLDSEILALQPIV